MTSPPRWLRGCLIAVVMLLAGGLLFLSAMDRDLNHDEHQFIAPSVLLSREGLLPYRDYPMFHLPNLTFIYGALDHLTHEPIFTAKLLNVLASTAAIGLIFAAGTTHWHPLPLRPRHLVLAAAAVALLLSDQLFVFTAGKTWNHEFPAFLLIAATVAFVAGVEKASLPALAISGLCTGLAIGTRLTYLPTAAAFPLLLLFAPLPRRARGLGILIWASACGVALLPSLYFLVRDRERFLFDNLQFPRLRLEDAADSRVHKTMAWWRKLRFFFKEILAHSLPLTAAFLITAFHPIKRWFQQREKPDWGLLTVLAVLPLAIVGCALPSRYQYQHYFAVAPLFALSMAYGARSFPGGNCVFSGLLVCATLVGLSPLNSVSAKAKSEADPQAGSRKRPGGIRAYAEVTDMLNPRNWFSNKLRADYAFVSRVNGPILTLAPIGVLNAGGRIVPEFATGPFAWRTAHLLPAEKRRQFGLVAPEDLEGFFAGHPPAGILTGVEDEPLEKPFITYAEAHHYQPLKVTKRRTLWLAPAGD